MVRVRELSYFQSSTNSKPQVDFSLSQDAIKGSCSRLWRIVGSLANQASIITQEKSHLPCFFVLHLVELYWSSGNIKPGYQITGEHAILTSRRHRLQFKGKYGMVLTPLGGLVLLYFLLIFLTSKFSRVLYLNFGSETPSRRRLHASRCNTCCCKYRDHKSLQLRNTCGFHRRLTAPNA